MSLRSRVALITALAVAAIAFAIPAAASAFGPLSSFGSFGAGAGQFSEVEGLAVGADGNVYVADANNVRIDVFSAGGAFLHAFGAAVNPLDGSGVCTADSGCKAGIQSAAAGAIAIPAGIAMSPTGLLYVGERENARISIFTTAGSFVSAFGKRVNAKDGSDVCDAATGCLAGLFEAAAGGLRNPRGLTFGPEGLLYVADESSNRIDVFTPSGTFVRAFGKGVDKTSGGGVCTTATGCVGGAGDASAGAMLFPSDVSFGPGGLLAVSDERNNRIDVFTPSGTFVRAFGKGVDKAGGGDVCTAVGGCVGGNNDGSAGSLTDPSAIEVSGDGRIAVADRVRNRVAEFGIDGGFIRAFGEGVVDGSHEFQVCTRTTGCRAGLDDAVPGATSDPSAVAFDCGGSLLVDTEPNTEPPSFAIQRLGEPGAELPCLARSEGPPRKPSNRFKFGRVRLNRARGTATLLVRVPGPGTLSLAGRGVRRVKATARKAGAVVLAVRPIGSARRSLLRTARARVRLRVTFRPRGGVPLTRSKALTLRAAPGR